MVSWEDFCCCIFYISRREQNRHISSSLEITYPFISILLIYLYAILFQKKIECDLQSYIKYLDSINKSRAKGRNKRHKMQLGMMLKCEMYIIKTHTIAIPKSQIGPVTNWPWAFYQIHWKMEPDQFPNTQGS